MAYAFFVNFRLESFEKLLCARVGGGLTLAAMRTHVTRV